MVMGLDVSCDGGGYFSPARVLALLKGVLAEGAFSLLGVAERSVRAEAERMHL